MYLLRVVPGKRSNPELLLMHLAFGHKSHMLNGIAFYSKNIGTSKDLHQKKCDI
jgi:hypothetical protein